MLFLRPSLLDTAVPNRSGKFIDGRRRCGCVLEPLFDCTCSVDSHSMEARSPSLPTEFDRVRDPFFDPENRVARCVIEDRDLSELTLEDLLDLPIGCFLVRRRDSLLDPVDSFVNSASSSFLKRLSVTFLSSSNRFDARFSFPWPAPLKIGEIGNPDSLAPRFSVDEARAGIEESSLQAYRNDD